MLSQVYPKASDLASRTIGFITITLSLVIGFIQSVVAQTIKYNGVATTTIVYPDVYKTSFVSQTVQTPVICGVVIPPQNGENNPLTLTIFPNNVAATSKGAISVFSSAPTYNNLLVQFWSYKATSNTQFSGQLVNPANELAFALNQVVYPLLLPPANIEVGSEPYSMSRGTQLAGAFSADFRQLNVIVQGFTIDGFRGFSSNIRCSL